MAFSYGLFNAKNLDRVYTAEDFTSYLSSLICNGILDTYGDNFSVTASGNLSVVIRTGKSMDWRSLFRQRHGVYT